MNHSRPAYMVPVTAEQFEAIFSRLNYQRTGWGDGIAYTERQSGGADLGFMCDGGGHLPAEQRAYFVHPDLVKLAEGQEG